MGEVPRNPCTERRRKREISRNKETNKAPCYSLRSAKQIPKHMRSTILGEQPRDRSRTGPAGPRPTQAGAPQWTRPAQEAGGHGRAWGAQGLRRNAEETYVQPLGIWLACEGFRWGDVGLVPIFGGCPSALFLMFLSARET